MDRKMLKALIVAKGDQSHAEMESLVEALIQEDKLDKVLDGLDEMSHSEFSFERVVSMFAYTAIGDACVRLSERIEQDDLTGS